MGAQKQGKDPEAMDDELDAINISFENYFDLGFVGGLLRANGEVVAFTFGEEMNPEVFCTHIEKPMPMFAEHIR